MEQVGARNQNRPRKGSTLKVEPIRDLADIQRIKTLLENRPRDFCLFVLGINSAYRANELLSLTVGQVAHLKPGDRLDLKQSKNSRYRAVTINNSVATGLARCLEWHPDPQPSASLFRSQKSHAALLVSTLSNMAKDWCAEAGLVGSFGSHTLRKTWGYHQRKTFNKPLSLLTKAYGHASEAQTLSYLCIQPEEMEELYAGEL